ncbi:MAG TPA: DUF3606 domain-containing protein [Pseudolabrys sp.]|nr:DUF3606 domain-containing protein [Pseudolabrys sp.]
MAKKAKRRTKSRKTTRGRSQDRRKVAGGQKYEVRCEAKKTRKSPSAVKQAIKAAGNVRKKIERALGVS